MQRGHALRIWDSHKVKSRKPEEQRGKNARSHAPAWLQAATGLTQSEELQISHCQVRDNVLATCQQRLSKVDLQTEGGDGHGAVKRATHRRRHSYTNYLKPCIITFITKATPAHHSSPRACGGWAWASNAPPFITSRMQRVGVGTECATTHHLMHAQGGRGHKMCHHSSPRACRGWAWA